MTRGFSLVELLVALTVTAVLGVALLQLLVTDSKFVTRQGAMMEARSTARAALNRLSVDFQHVSDGGVLAAAPESVTVRVPYAFGIGCRTISSHVVASMMPPDSLTYAMAVPGGVAKREANGAYSFWVGTPTITTSTDTASCHADSIRVVPGGPLVELQVPSPARPDTGQIFYLFEAITYKFAPSVDLPGRTGLWRRAGSGAAEEIVTPFDSTARFAFLTGPLLVPSASPPASLDSLRGLELHLIGESEGQANGDTDPYAFDLVTHVIFRNHH